METKMERTMRVSKRTESGSALFVAVMMLVLMGFLGLAALDRVGRDEQVAGFQNRARTAFYAAEAGSAEGRRLIATSNSLDDTWVPTFHDESTPRELGDTALYDREEGALPSYYGDPLVDDPIVFVKGTKKFMEGSNAANPLLFEAWWRINVVGESPDGSVSRMETMVIRPMAPSGS
jgi:hypothetical protein